MLFIDASFYLALLNHTDNNHGRAMSLGEKYESEDYVTSQMVLGEVLTVGSQRFDRDLTIRFVEEIFRSRTKIVLEKRNLLTRAMEIFKNIKSKNVSWVDCYSFAVMEKLGIKKALTFDKDFARFGPKSLPL